jgi:hypothetical protein
MFFPGKPFLFSVMQHSGLLGPFISYEKIKCSEYAPVL